MRRFTLIPALLTCSLLVLASSGCNLFGGTDTAHKVSEAVKVPGLDEAVLAKDEALKAAIIMTWKQDPELAQEQLAVEDVRAGKVRITGIVSRQKLKDRAEAMAKDQE